MQVEERALLPVLYVRPLHILRIEVLQRSFESTTQSRNLLTAVCMMQ